MVRLSNCIKILLHLFHDVMQYLPWYIFVTDQKNFKVALNVLNIWANFCKNLWSMCHSISKHSATLYLPGGVDCIQAHSEHPPSPPGPAETWPCSSDQSVQQHEVVCSQPWSQHHNLHHFQPETIVLKHLKYFYLSSRIFYIKLMIHAIWLKGGTVSV